MQAMGKLLATLVAPVFVLVGLALWESVCRISTNRSSWLLHRSIITHSPFIPLILLVLALRIGFQLYTFVRDGGLHRLLPSTTPLTYFQGGGRGEHS